MVFARRPAVTRRKFVRRRKNFRRAVIPRRPVTKYPTFTETIRLTRSDIIMTGSGTVVGQMYVVPVTDIPQWQNYANLYNQFRVNSVTYYLMPAWTASDAEWGPGAIPQPRFCYAIQNSSGAPNPTSEIDLLNDNGCKIRQSQKAIVIRTRPVPQLQQSAVGGATQVWTTNRNMFLSTVAATPITYGLVAYSCTTDSVLPPSTSGRVYAVYAKINFTLRDPM